MFEQGDFQMLNQIDRKLMIAPSSKLYDKSKFYGKIWVGFCLNTGNIHFDLDVSL